MSLIELVDVRRERDRSRVKSWLSTAHVSRWWGDATKNLQHFDSISGCNHAMIERDGQLVGYMRWEVVDIEVLKNVGINEIPEGSIDVDLFIGEPGNTGRGTGPGAVELLADLLTKTTSAPLIGFCTSVDNHRAHSAFQKAGCLLLSSFEDRVFGPCHVFGRWLR